MNCPNCSQPNSASALSCTNCGAQLIELEDNSLAEPYLRPGRRVDLLASNARHASRFLVWVLVLQVLPVVLLVVAAWKFGFFAGSASVAETIEKAKPLLFGFGLYALVIFAFLIAKTAQSAGSAFGSNFALSLLPPLLPAVWARIGGRSPHKPYLYILIDAALLAAAWFLLADRPLLLIPLILMLAPFVIYQFFGCALGGISMALGLMPEVVFIWVCVIPVGLLLLFGYESGLFSSLYTLYLSGTAGYHDALNQFGLSRLAELFAGCTYTRPALFMYLALSWLIWMHTVYENIKYPLLES